MKGVGGKKKGCRFRVHMEDTVSYVQIPGHPAQSSLPHACCVAAWWMLSHWGLSRWCSRPSAVDTRDAPMLRVEADVTTRILGHCQLPVDSTEWPGGSARADARDIRTHRLPQPARTIACPR